MPRTNLEVDLSFRNVREVRIGLAKGFGHSRWLVLQLVGDDGGTTDIATWTSRSNKPAELVIEDKLPMRLVQSIQDEEVDDA